MREIITEMKYKTALVTGASRGLGRAIGMELARKGLQVMLAARNENELRQNAESLKQQGFSNVSYVSVDLRSRESIATLFDKTRNQFGPIDVLVNNAGIGTYKPFIDWSEQEILDTVDVNLAGLMLCTHQALRDMIAEHRGWIINIASDLSRRPLPNMAPYVATKFGVLGFASSLLREVKQNQIKVCTIMPGIIDTNFNNSVEGTREETWALRSSTVAQTVAGLLDLPDHVVIDELVIHPLHQDF
jgi:short-subunit dehydrogenase